MLANVLPLSCALRSVEMESLKKLMTRDVAVLCAMNLLLHAKPSEPHLVRSGHCTVAIRIQNGA